MADTFINIEGLLNHGMGFAPIRQDESRHALAEPVAHDSDGVVAQLCDRSGKVLLRGGCEVRFPQGCEPGPRQAMMGWLRVSMPRYEQAAEIRLLHADRVIFKANIGKEPPDVKLMLIPGGDRDTAIFRCTVSDAAATLVFTLVDENGGSRAATVERKADRCTVALAPFAGSGKSRLRVQATHDLRTAQADSAPFDTPEPIVTGRIIAPASGAELAPDQALSLIGNLSIGQNGRRLPWKERSVHWVVDGVAVSSREQCAAVDGLEPGPHVIELRHGADPVNGSVLHRVDVHVRERSADEKEYAVAAQRYDELRADKARAGELARTATASVPGQRPAPGKVGRLRPCKCC